VSRGAHALHLAGEAGSVGAGEVAAILAESSRRFILATHRNPDGDALGSMLALARALRGAGRDAVMWHCEPDPVRPDMRFMFRPDEEILAELPPDADERTLRRVFGGARAAREMLESAGHPSYELSMGMSGDYEVAVEEGATMVRLGTVLFGARAT
jgi:hypothetical protein